MRVASCQQPCYGDVGEVNEFGVNIITGRSYDYPMPCDYEEVVNLTVVVDSYAAMLLQWLDDDTEL